MTTVIESFQQEVLHENQQIYQRIFDELQRAQSQVWVATPWFTDPDLFRLLLDLADRGIDVRVILGDNKDNRKLDFEKLKRKGATIYMVRKSGYGQMHKKFCIIDGSLAIHGSYNWTINARKNNHESVIVTNHTPTVASLKQQFEELEQNAMEGIKVRRWTLKFLFTFRRHRFEEKSESSPPQNSSIHEKASALSEYTRFQNEYAAVLESMIAAEKGNFDRELLRNQGYERAKACNGDAQVLSNAMDTIYSIFISDINIAEDKKRRLSGKMTEQKVIYDGALENQHQAQLRSLEVQMESARHLLATSISELKTKAGNHESEIEAIRKHGIPAAEKTERETEEAIQLMDRESVTPRFKWYEFIPVALFNIGLLLYLVLFYSSAVYILLFSERDAKQHQMHGQLYDAPHVFEHRAFSKILAEGGYAIGFVFLFVFIPLALSVTGRLAKGSFFSKSWVVLSLALLLDAGIAYKVAASIHQSEYLVGNTTEQWHFIMAFTEPNFYLVFLLGSLGLFIFHALFNKLISLFEERNPDIRTLQLKLKRDQEKEVLVQNRACTTALIKSVGDFEKELLKVQNEIRLKEMEQAELIRKKAEAEERAAIEFNNNRRVLNDVTAIYISRVENDHLLLSGDSMKDRINIFLEGWISYLNDQYAVVKAAELSRQAIEAAAAWQQQKISGNHIDNRIKMISLS